MIVPFKCAFVPRLEEANCGELNATVQTGLEKLVDDTGADEVIKGNLPAWTALPRLGAMLLWSVLGECRLKRSVSRSRLSKSQICPESGP
jgi:hypothetical protein